MSSPNVDDDGFETIEKGSIRVRYRPGSAAEQTAKPMASAAAKARRQLAGFGSEPDLDTPCIHLDDTIHDPDDPSALVTEGSVVDDEAGVVWMAVAAESPPEPPHRPLALLFGAGLPAIDEVELLVEGYGLHLADVANTRPQLATVDLPPLDEADGELRSAMAVDFVRFLLDRERRGDAAAASLGAERRGRGPLRRAVRRAVGGAGAGLASRRRRRRTRRQTDGVPPALGALPPPLLAAPARGLRVHVAQPRVHGRLPVRVAGAVRHRHPERGVQ